MFRQSAAMLNGKPLTEADGGEGAAAEAGCTASLEVRPRHTHRLVPQPLKAAKCAISMSGCQTQEWRRKAIGKSRRSLARKELLAPSSYRFPKASNDECGNSDARCIRCQSGPRNACSASKASIVIDRERHSVWEEAVETRDGAKEVDGVCDHEHQGCQSKCEPVLERCFFWR
jgi:hypothetical protein